ncbi:M14 family zinc carboxypeptidase [Rhodoferax saidenbachensis]|uniref:Zinc carboxypeptidase n=1 Tax=Rhodoferax saidenbachensis TaxID=1484693 RepID=A0A1P8K8N8_9BURK|nr:M14 family zinc carboxypeptidase [Rhodoferax saidenbachensis]APW42362.1 zinc carboxypeptidase [Rhodoferax saidenbachensis]
MPHSTVDLPELAALERIMELGAGQLKCQVADHVPGPAGRSYPLYTIALGNPSRDVPAVGYFGGVHGLERIGAEVVIAYLHSLVMRLQWDSTLHRQLESVRLVFMPIVNPGGMALGTRANPRGVDLMRNAPVEASEPVPFLVGGQRISARLPWYRGLAGQPMEAENQAVCTLVQDELLSRAFSLAVDCHSGFGTRDRIWFPYAHTRAPITHLAEVQALRNIFFQSHSHHRYIFEPQSQQYLAHGDLWDHLYQQSCTQAQGLFLPLTLEMGSWLWVKKNPRQLFSRHGIFNPLIEHRQQRVLRQHQSLLDFLSRAACGHALWLPTDETRAPMHAQALQAWY